MQFYQLTITVAVEDYGFTDDLDLHTSIRQVFESDPDFTVLETDTQRLELVTTKKLTERKRKQ